MHHCKKGRSGFDCYQKTIASGAAAMMRVKTHIAIRWQPIVRA
jgi:hypothetical protein